MDDHPSLFHRAVNDFHQARRKARLENILLTFQGKPKELMSYDEVRHKLRATEGSARRLQEIPLDSIVGSVNRYTDFTRSFLPRQESDRERWARVKLGVERMAGLPPIEAYKIGDVYFVLDGHHRVSVARELGADTIEGYVIPVYTRVPPSPTDRPDDIIIKAEYVEFLSRTRIDDLRPGANLLVTAPGQYQKLHEHIAVHRYFMGERLGREVKQEEAVIDWYDTVYLPLAQLIRERDLLRDFPHRTETDLYIWIMDYRSQLGGGEIGWEVPVDRAAADFSARFSPQRRLPRLLHRISDVLVPDTLSPGPAPGQWRSEHPSPHRLDHLFDDMLVTVPGAVTKRHLAGWAAVKMAVEVARREEARLTGIHVVRPGEPKDTEEITAIRREFLRRCDEAGIFGRLIVEEAEDIAPLICRRSPWVDLVVFRMNYPPPTQPLKRLRSGARLMIRQCSSPILAVPDSGFNLDGGALLAYGPGRKADEALFVATYLAGAWKIPLTVVTAKADTKINTSMERARSYLNEHGINEVSYIEEGGDPTRAVVLNAEAQNCGFIVMGGYESSPVYESIFGSTVDRVLRSTRRPVLICR